MKKLLFFSLLIFLTHHPANAAKMPSNKQPSKQPRSSRHGQEIAPWQKADTLFGKRQFAVALKAYDELSKNPPHVSMMCGNAFSEQEYITSGACL